jgi:hypothetical protein
VPRLVEPHGSGKLKGRLSAANVEVIDRRKILGLRMSMSFPAFARVSRIVVPRSDLA